MYLSYQIRCIGLGKWKRRCHGCSDVRHDVQRTSLGGQIHLLRRERCVACVVGILKPAQPPPLETGRHKRMQHNTPDHHSSVYSLTCTTTTTTTTRPVRLPPPLPSERGTTSHHAIDDRSATSSSINHSVQSRALHASSLVKQQQQQQQHCPASITPPRNPREHVRSSDLHAMAVLHSQRPQSRSTSCRAAAADPGTIISLALRH